ncbi:hypothetical protein VTN96DRAFT_6155 [Rasamsonia emersonii]|uniref:Uncharacterized protein n=1 Tax=Rasamsonia emersonii (strain ATCC 16479 / CBS 393.64 / IMI 116815) TaxID=1408163 RepID=A0A0F4YTD4_RASE3|nr:hypothetical protein T310_4423 [Rasamsonia emersonii CBS 393.64]KKA21552.1 hypothetical protein T310_4423 [Rasamsonia emersonii CBS 393.64]
MSNPTSPTTGEDVGNHPTTSTAGGASAVPTPANNAGGGSGWGDKGFHKGGGTGSPNPSQGLGHAPMPNPAASFGNFLGLQEQKHAAEYHSAHQFERAAGYEKATTESGEETCASEDHSFMYHTPGCPQNLPGANFIKDAWERATKYGRGA